MLFVVRICKGGSEDSAATRAAEKYQKPGDLYGVVCANWSEKSDLPDFLRNQNFPAF